jgi:hypothetical protein
MKKLLLSLIGAFVAFTSISQVSLFSENFETGGASISLNTGDLGGASVGNTWLINNVYTGGAGSLMCLGFPFAYTVVNVAAQPVSITNSPNSFYMHTTAQYAITDGILCGSYAAADGFCVFDETNFAKMSAPISTVGYTGVALDFWWVCGGAPEAYGEVYYSLDGGITWTLKQAPYSNSLVWVQSATLTDPLWDNAASLLIGFNFHNFTAAAAADPGFSVDEIEITGLVAANSIATDPINMLGWCEGATTIVPVDFNANGTFNAANVYSAELSDGAGSFAAPTVIGTLASSASGPLSISGAISGATPAGSGYRIRVVASDPVTIGTDNGADIEIFALPTVTLSTFADVCINAPLVTLSGGSPAGGTYSGTGVSAGNFDPITAGPGSHSISYIYVDVNGCSAGASQPISVNNLPTVALGTYANVCVTEAAFTLTGGTPAGGFYSGSGVTAGSFDPATAGTGTHTITYTFTDSSGCTNTANQSLLVDACLSIDENEAASMVLYPNPTETSFTIVSELVIDQLMVMDMNGRTVKTFGNQNSYEVGELTAGMYMVHITSGDLTLVKRLMIH